MIREARSSDLATIQSILNAPDNLDKLAGYEDTTLLDAIVDPDAWFLVLEEGGEPVAFLWLNALSSTQGPKIEEFGAILPGGGHGSLLMTSVLGRLRLGGYTSIRLSVAGDNTRAIAFYRRFGFTEVAASPKAWPRRRGQAADVVVMSRNT